MDFSLLLVVATFLTGVIWAFDSLILKGQRMKAIGRSGVDQITQSEPVVVEYARSFFPILLLVLVLRSFLFEPFRIPSGSMMPTLLEGDFIFVNKFAYGLRLPVVNTKIFEIGEPERRRFVARRQSFHGSTLAALSVGGHAQRRATYAPILFEGAHVSPCYAYRGLEVGESATSNTVVILNSPPSAPGVSVTPSPVRKHSRTSSRAPLECRSPEDVLAMTRAMSAGRRESSVRESAETSSVPRARRSSGAMAMVMSIGE